MNELISIIVPIYNVAPYLRKCIDSILMQTYTNIEIILVDDGSTDEGRIICDEYKEKDNRVKVIHQSNSGLTVTRRNGVNYASGKYIGFVDGDDWIEPNMYEILYKYMKENDVQVVTSCGYRDYGYINSGKILGDTVPSGKYYINSNDKYILKRLFSSSFNENEYINGAVWNKLFLIDPIKKTLNLMDDRVHGFMDDNVCVIGSIISVESIYVSKDVLYHHREHKEAFTYKQNPKGFMQVNYAYLSLKEIIDRY